MCIAIRDASSGAREWTRVALEKLNRHYGTRLRMAEANQIFDGYVTDLDKPIKKRNSHEGFEEEFVYDFVVPDPGELGDIYFEFTLNEEDPELPVILIVSVHPPSFKRPR
ncbi:MAG: hypothetical protein HEQ23_09140 [Tepidisphaera sp.]